MSDIITFEVKGLEKMKLDFLTPSRYNKAMASALNTSATAHRKASISEAKKTFKIPEKRIKNTTTGPTTRLKLARAQTADLRAEIIYSSKRPGLQHYATRKTNPVRPKNHKGGPWGNPKFKIMRAKENKPLERGFFQHGKGGKGFGLWQREGKARHPFHRRTGPGIRQMYLHEPIVRKLEPALQIMLDAKFQANLNKFQK